MIYKFKRLSPKDSKLKFSYSLKQIYNRIRMLDGEGYPAAFIEFGDFKIHLHNAKLKKNSLIAYAKISRDHS